MAEAVLVVCPGRGTYGAAELGYLARHHGDAQPLATFDTARAGRGVPRISAVDGAAQYSAALHGPGENSAPLIYSAGILDFLALDPAKAEVVAVCGNSMGWYTALACAGAVSPEHGFAIADAMGVNSGTGEPGGQLLLTLVGDDWRPDPALRAEIDRLVGEIDGLYRSIDLGGMLLVAGTDAALAELGERLPPLPGRSPMRLVGHGPFHTSLMGESSRRALAQLPADWFGGPRVPLIDGQGRMWRPFSSDRAALHDYTFTTQILEPFDFTRALTVALKEFAPDRIVLVGPGETLGGGIGQVLVRERWLGMADKGDFAARQAEDPVLLAMNRPEQRALVA